MNEEEFRKYQITSDQKSLEEKVRRWKQLQPVTYGQPLPELMWEYVTEVDEMFKNGHFIGVVLLCAGIAELVLADQLVVKVHMDKDEVERFNLEQMAILAHRLKIVTEKEKGAIDELRRLRNALIHANAGKISKMAKRRYGDFYEGVGTEFYLFPLSKESGISADALKHLRFTRDFTSKFYGVEP
jgi:hypothetical protein